MTLLLELNCNSSQLEDKKIFDIEITEENLSYYKDELPSEENSEEFIKWLCENYTNEDERELLATVYDFVHGECGECGYDITYKYKDLYFICSYDVSWDRYDKQYYFIDSVSQSDYQQIFPDLNTDGIVTKLKNLLKEYDVIVTKLTETKL